MSAIAGMRTIASIKGFSDKILSAVFTFFIKNNVATHSVSDSASGCQQVSESVSKCHHLSRMMPGNDLK